MKKITVVLGLILALAACADEPAPSPAQTAHALPPKIMLNVKTISLTDRSVRQPLDSPYIDNRFTPTISEAIKQWAGDRLQAVGQSGQAIVVVKEAALTSQVLQTSDSIDTWFTRQQGLRYTGHAEVSLEANAAPGFAMADASATRSVTMPEHPTQAERQDAYYTLLNGLMRDLGQNLEASIQAHMGSFIVSSPVYGSTSIPATGASSGMMPPVMIPSSAPSMQIQPPKLSGVQSAPVTSMQDEMPVAGPQQGFALNEQPVAPVPAAAQAPTSLTQQMAAAPAQRQSVSIPLSGAATP